MKKHIDKIQKYLHNGDADVLQHCLYNPLFPVMEHEKYRYQCLLTEYGI